MATIGPLLDAFRKGYISRQDLKLYIRADCLPYWQRYFLARQELLWEGLTPTPDQLEEIASSPSVPLPAPSRIGELTASERNRLLRVLTLALGTLESSLLAEVVLRPQQVGGSEGE